jgi:hypothetical protein
MRLGEAKKYNQDEKPQPHSAEVVIRVTKVKGKG